MTSTVQRNADKVDGSQEVLMLLEDDIPFKTQLRVHLVDDEDVAQVEFRKTLKQTDRTRLLCKLHLPLPSRKMPRAADPNLRELAQQPGESEVFLAREQIKLEASRGKTELLVNLERIALEKGFVISDNQGDGNCMFFALSEQLDHIKGIKITHEELRRTVVQYLKDNPRLPDGTDLIHFVDGYSSWNAYLTTMMADGTWGDHVILHGAANCFETCVHVISSLPHHHDVIICPEYDVTGSNRLVLGHMYELHYVSLIPLEGC